MTTNAPFQLMLWGPARLEHQGREVKLQRKGLAILYYLALEGPTRREVLADLLWGHSAASQNLRVELYRLSQVLSPLGFTAFAPGEDPLRLPSLVFLDRTPGPGLPLEGLEEVSTEFRAWLEGQRSQLVTNTSGTWGRERLVHEIANQIRLPYALILMGRPGSGRTNFAQSLAKTLGLPFLEGLRGNGKAVHYLRQPYPEGALERILADREGLWVVECSAYGEDPRLILELRSGYPPERMRFIHLPPLSWSEARAKPLAPMTFSEAARVYLASGGNPGHLRELLALSPMEGEMTGTLPLPQRVRAMLQLEARMLSLEARLAIERLSIHPGPLSEGLLRALEASPYLDELERRGWLIYDGHWRFSDESSRRVFYQSLQPGRRQQYHRQAALQFALEGQRVAEAYHRLLAGDTADWGTFLKHLEGWSRAALEAWLGMPGQTVSAASRKPMVPGGELAMLEESRFGSGFQAEGRRLVWVRQPTQASPSGVEWILPEESCLVHLHGQVHLENPLGIGVSGEAAPLVIEIHNHRRIQVFLLSGVSPGWLDEYTLLLPLAEQLDYWFWMPAEARMRLSSRAESAILDLEVSAHRVLQGTPGEGRPAVEAFVLGTAKVLR